MDILNIRIKLATGTIYNTLGMYNITYLQS